MVKKTVRKVLGDPQEQMLKVLKKRVAKINSLESEYKKLSDAGLKAKSAELKSRVQEGGEKLDKVLPEAFALVREAASRVLGQRHFDVQLIGGMVLHKGQVAEMKTGEGKTLVATLPVYLNALSGKGVHVVTVNDYLAQRDAGWMAKVYDFLGLSVGVVIPEKSFVYDASYEDKEHADERFWNLRPATRKEAYAADITYGTNNEFGFDYLRDNMVSNVDDLRQRQLSYAIVDEVDSILVDEARTPLIISSSAAESGAGYRMFAEIATHFTPEDYVLDEKRNQVNLTDEGIAKVEDLLQIENLYAPENVHHIFHLNQALRAQTLFKKDKEYVISKDGEIIIVDANTGRLLPGRRYNEGLHQAIEAKEDVEVKEESVTLATISFQNYFRLYDKLAEMTGTAKTEEEEFVQVYGMDVIQIPSNKKIIRKDRNDRIYATEAAKFKAIIQKVKELQETGQPVLIGTVSIEKNEILSHLLAKEGVKHQVLNAKNNEGEAQIVSAAGQEGAVTLATNIAGRGTDIVLTDKVKELGGLFVLGSERHESRRIDNQLRGRSGRQGDPGETQFYISAEDELMRVFGGDTIARLMARLSSEDDDPIEKRSISKAIERSQRLVEGMHFDSRKNVVEYDDVMNRHRRAVYTNRKAMLEAKDHQRIEQLIAKTVQSYARQVASEIITLNSSGKAEDAYKLFQQSDQAFELHPDANAKALKVAGLEQQAKTTDKASSKDETKRPKKSLIGRISTKLNLPAYLLRKSKKTLSLAKRKIANSKIKRRSKNHIKQLSDIYIDSFDAYVQKAKDQVGEEATFRLQRGIYLQILDELWMQHLENMDHLREGIGWRGVGQKDPLVEYRFEGQRIFDDMMTNLKLELTNAICHINPKDATSMSTETELTKAAGDSATNTNQISTGLKEFEASDFSGATRIIEVAEDGSEAEVSSSDPKSKAQKAHQTKSARKSSRKKQRQNKKKGRR